MKNNDKVINDRVCHKRQLLEFSAFDKFYSLSEFWVILFEFEFFGRVELIFHRKVAISAFASQFDDNSIAFFSHERNEQK